MVLHNATLRYQVFDIQPFYFFILILLWQKEKKTWNLAHADVAEEEES
jgi:hypothetical protein